MKDQIKRIKETIEKMDDKKLYNIVTDGGFHFLTGNFLLGSTWKNLLILLK